MQHGFHLADREAEADGDLRHAVHVPIAAQEHPALRLRQGHNEIVDPRRQLGGLQLPLHVAAAVYALAQFLQRQRRFVAEALLGAGGGGDPYIGKLLAIGAVKECGEVSLIDVDELSDDDVVVPVASVGAPPILTEKGVGSNEFTKLIEGCGAEVVCDRHCYGAVESRAPIVVKDGEKPLTAVARHYLETSTCPRFMPQDIMRERKQRLADLAKEYKADGIIVASNKFCEYWSYERTIDTIVMPRDFGYPVCSIEKEYINGASGQLRTRFQAFVESIEIKKIQEGK